MKRITLIVCCMVLLCVAFANGAIKNPDTFILADISTIATLDPALAYDSAAISKVMTVYEGLIAFDLPHTDIHQHQNHQVKPISSGPPRVNSIFFTGLYGARGPPFESDFSWVVLPPASG